MAAPAQSSVPARPTNMLAAQVAAAAQRPQPQPQPAQPEVHPQPQLAKPQLVPRPIPAAAPQVLSPTAASESNAPADLSTLHSQFLQYLRQTRQGLAGMAYTGYRLNSADSWASLGYSSAEDFCATVGITSGMWQQYLTLGQRLQAFSLAEIQELTLSAAKSLTEVNPKLWDEYAWVQEARLLPAREFASLVHQRNQQLSPKILAEPKIQLAVTLPESEQRKVSARLDDLRRRSGLKTQGQALTRALDEADRAAELETKLTGLVPQLESLLKLWTDAEESPEELAARHTTGDQSLTRTAAESLLLAQRLLEEVRSL